MQTIHRNNSTNKLIVAPISATHMYMRLYTQICLCIHMCIYRYYEGHLLHVHQTCEIKHLPPPRL